MSSRARGSPSAARSRSQRRPRSSRRGNGDALTRHAQGDQRGLERRREAFGQRRVAEAAARDVAAGRESQRRLIAARDHDRGCAVEPNVLRPERGVAGQQGPARTRGVPLGAERRRVLGEVELEPGREETAPLG